MGYYTFANLGRWGAFGNQLWQLAGVSGEAFKVGAVPRFPRWFYEPFFSYPSEFFVDNLPEGKDFGESYMQNLDHWWEIRENIFAWSSPSDKALHAIDVQYRGIDLFDYTAVHVRRANNLTLPDHHPVPTIKYFEDALDLISPSKIVVFSDDLDWCRQQPLFKGALFAEGNDSKVNVMNLTKLNPTPLNTVAYDFAAMCQCKNFIVSNSTFSVWAAMISTFNNNLMENNKVVYPNNWYGKAIADLPFRDMFKYFDYWIGIDG